MLDRRQASPLVLPTLLLLATGLGCGLFESKTPYQKLVETLESEVPDSCKEHFECSTKGCDAFCFDQAGFDDAKAMFEKHCEELGKEDMTWFEVYLGTESTTELHHVMKDCGSWEPQQTF